MAVQTGKISVVMPVYQVEKYLEEAVESVLSQDYTNWELFLLVRESEDESLGIAERYEKQCPKIHVIKDRENAIGLARNRGMVEADGEYLLFMDADDYLPDQAVFSRYVNLANKTGTDIVVSNYARLWKDRSLPATSHSAFSGYHRKTEEFRFRGFFSVGTLSYAWGKLYRRAFLEKHALRFSDDEYAEDKLFNMQCYLCEATYSFIENIGYIYRRNTESVSYQYNPKSSHCWFNIANTLQRWMEEQGTDLEIYQGLVDYTIFFASFFDAKKEYQHRKKSLWSIRHILRVYGKDPMGKAAFRQIVADKTRIPQLEQTIWKVIIKGFSLGMKWKCYLLLSIGIQLLIRLRVDERMSDTGLRE